VSRVQPCYLLWRSCHAKPARPEALALPLTKGWNAISERVVQRRKVNRAMDHCACPSARSEIGLHLSELSRFFPLSIGPAESLVFIKTPRIRGKLSMVGRTVLGEPRSALLPSLEVIPPQTGSAGGARPTFNFSDFSAVARSLARFSGIVGRRILKGWLIWENSERVFG